MQSVEKKDGVLNLFAKNILLSSEYFRESDCVNLNEYEKAADIGRSYVSIYNTTNKMFRTKKCVENKVGI